MGAPTLPSRLLTPAVPAESTTAPPPRRQQTNKEQLTLRELRGACKAAGFSSHGSKAVLRERLDFNTVASGVPNPHLSGCATSPAPASAFCSQRPGASSPTVPPAMPHPLSVCTPATPPTVAPPAVEPLSGSPRRSPFVSTTGAPDASAVDGGRQDSPARSSQPPARAPPSAAAPAQPRATDAVSGMSTPRPQASWFTKHEFSQLFHVMCQPGVAAGVVASRGPLTRQQIDAQVAKRDAWDTVRAPEFNDYIEVFDSPAERHRRERTSMLSAMAASSATMAESPRWRLPSSMV